MANRSHPSWGWRLIRKTVRYLLVGTAIGSFGAGAFAQTGGPSLTAEQLKELDKKGFQADPKILKEVATAGQPLGRWKEGLMFDGISPMPWLKSAANWIPGTEQVQPNEIRVTFMGSSPLPRPG